MGKAIVVTSGKGGVGKTTTTSNIGAGLASLGNKVVLVDMDTGLRNLDISLGLENRVVYTLMDILEKNCEIDQALVKEKHSDERLFLLAASQTNKKEDVPKEAFYHLIEELKQKFDYVLIDCPAGIEYGFTVATSPADEAIIVVTPDVTSVRDADRVIGLLENVGIKEYSLIINRYDPEMIEKKKQLQKEDISEILGLKIMGIIPNDTKITEAANKGEVMLYMNPLSPASKAFMVTAKKITGENIQVETKPATFNFKETFLGFFRRA
jgi:septum site-determining protein MinD